MSDSAKVRLVRCPKCQNLLPELADYSVYQCGGCGAVLRGTLFFSSHIGFLVLAFDFDELPKMEIIYDHIFYGEIFLAKG